MDMVITVIGWMIGLYAAFILMLAIGFSLGGATNTGKSELKIMSIASTFLLFYLIYQGFTFFFGSDDIDPKKTPLVVRTVQHDTTVIDVPSATPPEVLTVTENKTIPTQTKTEPIVHTQQTVAKVKKGYFDDMPYIPWTIYTLTFLFYMFWIFKPSKNKQTEKELVKQKLIATMTLKKDASGLQAWDPNWKPDE